MLTTVMEMLVFLTTSNVRAKSLHFEIYPTKEDGSGCSVQLTKTVRFIRCGSVCPRFKVLNGLEVTVSSLFLHFFLRIVLNPALPRQELSRYTKCLKTLLLSRKISFVSVNYNNLMFLNKHTSLNRLNLENSFREIRALSLTRFWLDIDFMFLGFKN